jgi:hypothetical protein
MEQPTTRVGIALFDGAEELDWAGPWEVLSYWSRYKPEDHIDVFTVARDNSRPIECANGLRVLADWDLWARLAREGSPACAREPLVGYRIHPGNASANIELILREARMLDGRYGASLEYGKLHHYLAGVYLRAGDGERRLRGKAVAEPKRMR